MTRQNLTAACGLPFALFLTGIGLMVPDAGRAEGLRYTIGLMAGASQSPFDMGAPEGALVPGFLVEGEGFSIGTSGLTVEVVETEAVTLSARVAPRFVTADPSVVPGLERLERDIAVEAGLSAGLTVGPFQAEIEALRDVSDTHGGAAVSATLGTGAALTDRLSIGAQIGATWMDQRLATYAFGVLPSEAGGGLATHAVPASVIASVGAEASYALGGNLTLVGGVSADILPDSVTASPIVQRDTVVSVIGGVRYAF